jgi:hypothetical protein
LFRVAIICIWSWKNCSGVRGGGIGIGWPVLWLFCPCWPEPVPVLQEFTIYLQQRKFIRDRYCTTSGKKTLTG